MPSERKREEKLAVKRWTDGGKKERRGREGECSPEEARPGAGPGEELYTIYAPLSFPPPPFYDLKTGSKKCKVGSGEQL